MSDIDFQNGFFCGMATKGLTRSGEEYEPICWNDDGIYNYFYIDFKLATQDFSTGMFFESIIVSDTAQLIPTNVERVSASVFKIVVDLSPCIHGVTVLNKVTSFLHFVNGNRVPAFSITFSLTGMVPFLRSDYAYNRCGIFDGVSISGSADFEPVISFEAWETEDTIFESVSSVLWSPTSVVEKTVSVIKT